MIYFDHNATTPVRPEALEAMLPFLKNEFGNASSIYQLGQRSRKAIEDARAQMAAFVGTNDPNEIVFTSGGTEANNTAIKGVVKAFQKKGKRIVSSPIEHSSVRNVIRTLAEFQEADNVVVPVQPNGIVDPKQIEEAMTPDTILVSVMAANNEVGTLQPIKEIAEICRKKGVLFHTDAVQLGGKYSISVNEWGVDLLTLSGHKFGAPKGVGVLYIRKGTRLEGLIQGGRQEKNRRAGTENIPGIVGMGMAAELALKDLSREQKHLSLVRDTFETQILNQITHTFVNGDRTKRTCNTTNIGFGYMDSSQLIMALDLIGVSCSNGSACMAGSADPSHVLLAMGLTQDKAHASLRFSFGYTTTEEEIKQAVPLIKKTVDQLRLTNPLWKEVANG